MKFIKLKSILFEKRKESIDFEAMGIPKPENFNEYDEIEEYVYVNVDKLKQELMFLTVYEDKVVLEFINNGRMHVKYTIDELLEILNTI